MRILFALFATALPASAHQSPDALVHQDFETDAAGWSAMGAGGAIHITHQPGQTHSGNDAPAFTCEVKRGQIAAAVPHRPPWLACNACVSG